MIINLSASMVEAARIGGQAMTVMAAHRRDMQMLEKQVQLMAEGWDILRRIDLKDLIPIIKQPGWTTPAEFMFATTLVGSLQAQVDQLAATAKGLLQASREVGRG
jgi:hypothetical protein